MVKGKKPGILQSTGLQSGHSCVTEKQQRQPDGVYGLIVQRSRYQTEHQVVMPIQVPLGFQSKKDHQIILEYSVASGDSAGGYY